MKEHKKVVCVKCDKVISQCRCMGYHKTIEYSICKECKQKEDSLDFMDGLSDSIESEEDMKPIDKIELLKKLIAVKKERNEAVRLLNEILDLGITPDMELYRTVTDFLLAVGKETG